MQTKLDITLYKCTGCHMTDTSKRVMQTHCDTSLQCKCRQPMPYVFEGLDFKIDVLDAFLNIVHTPDDHTWCKFGDFLKAFKKFEGTTAGYETLQTSTPTEFDVKFDKFGIVRTYGHDGTEYLLNVTLDNAVINSRMDNSLEEFLCSNDVIMDPEKYVPFDDFRRMFKSFEITTGRRPSKCTLDFCRNAFSKFKIVKVHDTLTYNGARQKKDYLVGVDLVYSDTV